MKNQINISPVNFCLMLLLIAGIISGSILLSRQFFPPTTVIGSGSTEKTLSLIKKYSLYPISPEQEKKIKNFGTKALIWKFREIDKYADIKIESEPLRNEEDIFILNPEKKFSFKRIGKDITYIQFESFSKRNELMAVATLRVPPTDKIILDLRNNPGGNVEEMTWLADLFLPAGIQTITIKKKAAAYNPEEFLLKTTGAMVVRNELFLLVDETTKSAAEALADVIQRKKRGTIIGRPTFGKNQMQLCFEIEPGIMISITAALMEYKSGGNKIIPDIEISPGENALEAAVKYIKSQK